ncbi:MAG: NAD(P)H-dependent flavin oxidoreductase [Promethearchaeota archaeon]
MVIETNITKMLGIKHPILSAPMGPFYTTDMAIAVSEAGGLGVLSHSSDFETDLEENYSNINSAVDALKRNMLKFVEHSDKPFGFNIRTARMQIDAEMMCRKIPKFIMENPKLKEQCVYAITSAGSARTLPKSKTYQKLKDSGSNIKHFHVAPALWLADKCVASGVDGLVVTGGEGGGHQSYEKVSSLVLLQQVVQKHPDFPIVACGGFATGQGLAAALSMGAGAVAMGSRFIATKESEFHEAYKNVVPPAKAQDTILVTGGFGPIRLWRNEYSLHHGLVGSKEEKIAQEQAVSLEQAKKDAMAYVLVYQGNTTDGAVLLGQSIGVINNIKPVKEVIDTTIEDAEKYLKKASAYIK